jgi:hypothetical protein
LVSMQEQRPNKVPRRDISSNATEQVGKATCMPTISAHAKGALIIPVPFFCRGYSKVTWRSMYWTLSESS